MGHDFRQKSGAGNPQAPYLRLVTRLSVCSLDVFLNQLGDVLDASNLRGLEWLRRLGVFAVTRAVGQVVSPTGLNAGGVGRGDDGSSRDSLVSRS